MSIGCFGIQQREVALKFIIFVSRSSCAMAIKIIKNITMIITATSATITIMIIITITMEITITVMTIIITILLMIIIMIKIIKK